MGRMLLGISRGDAGTSSSLHTDQPPETKINNHMCNEKNNYFRYYYS